LIPDCIGDFANRTAYLFNNPEPQKSLGQAARAFIEVTWTWERHFLNLEQEMYDMLVCFSEAGQGLPWFGVN
jgi:hypothetical protein